MSDRESGSGESNNQQQSSGDGQQQHANSQQGNDQQQSHQQSQPSANQRIKAYAQELGISVEDLIDDHRTLRDATRTEQERKDAAITKLQREQDANRTTIRDLRADKIVTAEATKANAIDSDAIYALVKGSLEFDKDDKPTNAAQAIEDLRKAKPHLFRGADGSGDGGQGGSSETSTNMNRLIARRLGRG